jgi:hypothetical protein
MAQLLGNPQYTTAVAVTPGDATVFYFLGFLVGVGGTITVRPKDSAADVQITAVAGTVYPIEIIAVRATGTAATGIVGLG